MKYTTFNGNMNNNSIGQQLTNFAVENDIKDLHFTVSQGWSIVLVGYEEKAKAKVKEEPKVEKDDSKETKKD